MLLFHAVVTSYVTFFLGLFFTEIWFLSEVSTRQSMNLKECFYVFDQENKSL